MGEDHPGGQEDRRKEDEGSNGANPRASAKTSSAIPWAWFHRELSLTELVERSRSFGNPAIPAEPASVALRPPIARGLRYREEIK
jgi:hypothetical protein